MSDSDHKKTLNRPALMKMKERSRRNAIFELGYPFTVWASFTPHGVPENHPIRLMHDDRAITDEAPDGFWEIDVWDIENDHMPIGRAAFVATKAGIVCEWVAVEPDYCGRGLGHKLIDMGKRIWGAPVLHAERYSDRFERLWYSFSTEN